MGNEDRSLRLAASKIPRYGGSEDVLVEEPALAEALTEDAKDEATTRGAAAAAADVTPQRSQNGCMRVSCSCSRKRITHLQQQRRQRVQCKCSGYPTRHLNSHHGDMIVFVITPPSVAADRCNDAPLRPRGSRDSHAFSTPKLPK